MNATLSDRILILNPREFPILAAFILLQIVVGSSANIAVICMFYVRRGFRRRPSDLLILSLSTADLLCCVTILPWLLNVLVQRNLGGGSFFFFASLNIFEIACCENAVTAIAMDRFFAVVYNLRYQAMMTRSRTYFLIAFSWSSALVAGIGGFVCYNLRQFSFYEKFLWAIQILNLLLVFFMYGVIFHAAWTQTLSIRAQRKSVTGTFEQARLRLVAKTVWNSFAIVCLFYASFLPFLIYDIVSSLDKTISKNLVRTMLIRFFSFTYISCCINPFIYVFRRRCSTQA